MASSSQRLSRQDTGVKEQGGPKWAPFFRWKRSLAFFLSGTSSWSGHLTPGVESLSWEQSLPLSKMETFGETSNLLALTVSRGVKNPSASEEVVWGLELGRDEFRSAGSGRSPEGEGIFHWDGHRANGVLHGERFEIGEGEVTTGRFFFTLLFPSFQNALVTFYLFT